MEKGTIILHTMVKIKDQGAIPSGHINKTEMIRIEVKRHIRERKQNIL